VNPRYLLDTNILSEPLAAKPSRQVLAMLERHQESIATTTPVWHELIFGCQRLPSSKKRRAIERYLDEVILATIPILPYDEAAATWHGAQRAKLAAKGVTPTFVDGQIAAIAKRNDLILVTRNLRDFKIFKSLHVENWFE
jgi:tRNA(fMet)-specific endonuclease VapC